MTAADPLVALDEQGRLLVDAAELAGLGAPVPGCPGWTVADLLRHIGLVHRFAVAVVRAGGPELDQDAFDRDADVPGEEALAGWVRAGHRELVHTLTEAPADLSCWTFWPAPQSREFWIRRQLHETAIHRIDAELAAGLPPTPLAPELAADGIDELLTGLAPFEPFYASTPRRLTVVAQDAGCAWTVTIGPHPPAVVRGQEPADCTLTGPADALYGYVWNRTDDGVAVDGDTALAALWHDGVRISR